MHTVNASHNIMVPMRDGVRLATSYTLLNK